MAELGSASGQIQVDVAQALANLDALSAKLKGMDGAGTGVGGGLTQANGRLDAFGNKVTEVGAKYRQVGLLSLGVGALVAGGFGVAISSAADFEQAMDGVSASLGGVGTDSGITEEQFKRLGDTAIQIGADTAASATEVASVMDILAKGGISVEEIYGGVAQTVVDVSQATGESLDQTASSVGSLQNLFRDTGISASEMGDVIVNGMNASQATLSEFQTGVSRLAPYIIQTGASFEEAAGLISYFNAQGLSAAEVGTSLTAAYNNLIAPTTEMTAAQEALGIQVYDTQGKFVGFPSIMDQVQKATEGMSEADAAAAVNALFGADARDVMSLALKDGGKPLQDYIDLMDTQGTAAKASQERMDNLKGSIEQLKGGIESAMIVIGSKFIPIIRKIADGLSALVNGFLKLPSPIQTALAAIVGIVGAVLGLAGAFVVFGPSVVSAITLIGGAGAAIAALAAPILLVVEAIALLGVAYKTNFLGFADAVNGLASGTVSKLKAIGSGVATFAKLVKFSFDLFRGRGQNPIEASLNAMSRGVDYAARQVPALAGVLGHLSNGMKTAADWTQRLGKQVKLGQKIFASMRASGLNPVAAALKTVGALVQNVAHNLGPFSGAALAVGKALGVAGQFAQEFGDRFTRLVGVTNPIGAALAALGGTLISLSGHFGIFGSAIENVGKAFMALGSAITQGWKGLKDLLDGNYSGAADRFRNALQSMGLVFSYLGKAASDAFGAIRDQFEQVDWSGLADRLMSTIGSLADRFLGALGSAAAAIRSYDFGPAFDAIQGAGSWLLSKGSEAIQGLLNGLTSAWAFITTWGANIGIWLAEAVGDANTWIRTKGSDAVQGLLDGLDSAWAFIETWAGNIGSRIKTAAGDASTWFDGVGSPAIDGLLTDLETGLDSMVVSLQGTFESLKTRLQPAIEKLFDFQPAGDLGQRLGERFGNFLNGLDWGGLFGSYASISAKFYQGLSTAVVAGVGLLAGIVGQIGAFIGGFLVGMFERIEWGRITDRVGTLLGTAIQGASNALGAKVQGISDTLGRVLTDALNGVKIVAGDLAAWASGLAGSVLGAITNGIKGMVGFAAAIKNRVVQEFSETNITSGSLSSWASTIATSAKDAIVNGVKGMVGFAASIKAQILQEFNEAIPSAGDLAGFASSLGSGLLDALKSWVQGNLSIGDIVGWITGGGGANRVGSTLGRDPIGSAQDRNTREPQAVKLPAPDFSAVTAALAAMNAMVNAAFVQMVTAANVGVTAMASLVGTGFATMSATVSVTVSTMTANVAARFAQIAAQAGAITASMSAQVSAQVAAMSAQASATVSSMAAQVGARLSAMAAQASSSANSMRSSVGAAMSGMASQASSAMNQFASSVQSGFQRAAAAAQSGVNQIRSAVNSIGSLYGQGLGIGSSLGQGIAAGIASTVGSIAAAAANAVTTAVNAANAAAKINSPSKLTMKTGMSLAEGLEVGINKGARDVFAAMSDLIPAGNGALAMQSLPVTGRSAAITTVVNVYPLKSDEYQRLITNAQVGGDFARSMPRNLTVGGAVRR